MQKLQPPGKGHPLFSATTPVKIEILSSPFFWKFGRRLNSSPAENGGEGGEGEVHTMFQPSSQQAFTWSKPTMETPEQCVKSVQS